MIDLDQGFADVLDGRLDEAATKTFLEQSIARMADPGALAAGARALRSRMVRVRAPAGAIDVCGTGGDGAHTLNVSTAVALVVAGAGVPVATHGNRAMSSRSGAADVLEALGVRLTGDAAVLERCLCEAGAAFLFAQNHHPAMRHVAQARRALGQRTIFNLLGPLSNPAGVERQLVGVFAPEFATPVAQALRQLGAVEAWVVHGAGGLDEIGLSGPSLVETISTTAPVSLAPSDLGLDGWRPYPSLTGGDAAENAAALRLLLEEPDRANPDYRAIVLANAAAALAVSGFPLRQALDKATQSLQSGRALSVLDTLTRITGEGAHGG